MTDDDDKALVERLATAIKEGMGAQLSAVPIHPNPAVDDWTATGGAIDLTKIAEGLLPIIADRIEALSAENERLRGVLEAVWKEATTMRNARKLVGPYPKEPANNRVWARSMYHAGRKLHALIKPVRTALGERP